MRTLNGYKTDVCYYKMQLTVGKKRSQINVTNTDVKLRFLCG